MQDMQELHSTICVMRRCFLASIKNCNTPLATSSVNRRVDTASQRTASPMMFFARMFLRKVKQSSSGFRGRIAQRFKKNTSAFKVVRPSSRLPSTFRNRDESSFAKNEARPIDSIDVLGFGDFVYMRLEYDMFYYKKVFQRKKKGSIMTMENLNSRVAF